MSGPAELLREIHRLRRFARDLQEQIDRAPRQLQLQKAKVTRQEEGQRDAVEALKKLKVLIHEREVTLKTTHAQIVKHQGQLNAAASKKEYDALAAEIKSEKQRFATLEEEILTGMSEIEERTAQLPELEANVVKARAEFKQFEAGAAQRTEGFKQQLLETMSKLKEIEPGIPGEVRTQYNRMVTSMGADSFAAVIERNCSACNTSITVQQYTELLMQSFVVCKSCGRMLYLPA